MEVGDIGSKGDGLGSKHAITILSGIDEYRWEGEKRQRAMWDGENATYYDNEL